MPEIMRNSCTACRGTPEVTKAFKKLKHSHSFENLNDVDIISMPMFATCKDKMERIILFIHEKSRIGICFLAASSQRSSARISHGSENFDFRC